MRPVRVALCVLMAAAPLPAQRLAITSATVIDGRTGRAAAARTILIEGERISAVGPGDSIGVPPGVTVIDASGEWVLPGFIDVHAHSTAPAVLQRALALGVTTVHMMPSRPAPADSLRYLERWSALPATPSPRLRITSPLFTGTFPANVMLRATNFVKPQGVTDVERDVPQLRQAGFRGIKIIQDDGRLWSGESDVVPRLSDDVFRALVQEAHRHGLTVYAHLTQIRDARQAIAAGVDVFVHGIMDSVLTEPLWQRMREQRIVWAPAFRIVAQGADRAGYARRILTDAILFPTLSETERTALISDTLHSASAVPEVFTALPHIGTSYLRVLGANTRTAQRHGVTVAAGSDAGASGNGPGIGTHMEMEYLQECGLTPAQVVVAATFGGAVALRLENELGTIEPGRLADLVIVARNPMLDVRNARAVEWVIKGGEAMRNDRLLSPRN